MHYYSGQTASGVLALRERMRSMQAAAAMSNMDGVTRLTANLNMNGGAHHVTEQTNSEVQVQHSSAPPMDERALSGLQARMERLKSSGAMDSF